MRVHTSSPRLSYYACSSPSLSLFFSYSFRFFSVLGSSRRQLALSKAIIARGASFRSQSGETVSSRGYEVIVRRPRSKKTLEREVRRSLDGDERRLSREEIETFGGAIYAEELGGEWRG